MGGSLAQLREEAAGCRACLLWKTGTQTVFGEGPARARLMLVGEQPGNDEDFSGHPFVGPAGKLLDDALQEAGIARSQAYVTNVVKHFKWKRAVRGVFMPSRARGRLRPDAEARHVEMARFVDDLKVAGGYL